MLIDILGERERSHMNARKAFKLGRQAGGKIVVWVLVASMISPPALLAQTLGGSSTTPVPYGMLPGGTPALVPGQPIITNPTALQPIVAAQAPCPAPPAPTQAVEGKVPALNEFWPTE